MQALPASALPVAAPQQPWRARLDIAVALRDGRSVLRHCQHRGPLRLQKALYPEGPGLAQLLMLHPPGGIAGGDELEISVEADAGAQLQLTTPGAGKWYKSAGRVARQGVSLRVQPGAVLEWLPQENILFNQAVAEQRLQLDCAVGARACGWDILVLGRQASAERFTEGRCTQRFELRCDGRLLWLERARLDGSDPLLHSPLGWDGQHVSGLMWVVGLAPDEALLEACRAVPAAGLRWGVTAPQPGLLLIRALGDSAERLRGAFTEAWSRLRPALCGRSALPPRIWST